MKRKRSIIVIFIVLVALLCSACSGATSAAKIVDKMQAALKKTPCTQATMTMDLQMTLDIEGDKTDLSVSTASDTTVAQEPAGSFTSAVTDVDIAGMTTRSEAESYTVIEDGEAVVYTNCGGIWTKTATGQSAKELAQIGSAVALDKSNTEIDESVTEWQGKPAICLTSQITGDAVQEMVSAMVENLRSEELSDTEEAVGEADYAKLSCDLRIFVDPETYLPMCEEMVFNGMNAVMAPIYEQMDVDVEVTSCTGEGIFVSYEPQNEICLPDGAAERAEGWARLLAGEPDNGDGTYTIREGAMLADITAPEGFELKEKDYDRVIFTRDDHRTIQYVMYYNSPDDTLGESFIAMADATANRHTTFGGYVQRDTMTLNTDSLEFTCDVVGTTWSDYEEGELHCWALIGADANSSYYLYVQISDGYDDGFGHKKNIDLTPEEFFAYLNAAAPGKLMG